MAFIPAPNTVMVELVYSSQGQITENTLYFYSGIQPTLQLMADLADIMADWWYNNMRPLVCNTTLLTAIKVTDLEQQYAPGIEVPVNPPTPGALNLNQLPNNATFAVTFLTELRGRSFRGRNYINGLSEEDVQNNRVTIGWAGNVVNAYLAIIPALAETEWEWVVLSRYSGNQPRDIGVVTNVTGVKYADLVIDSQRRRLPGRGK